MALNILLFEVSTPHARYSDESRAERVLITTETLHTTFNQFETNNNGPTNLLQACLTFSINHLISNLLQHQQAASTTQRASPAMVLAVGQHQHATEEEAARTSK